MRMFYVDAAVDWNVEVRPVSMVDARLCWPLVPIVFATWDVEGPVTAVADSACRSGCR